MSSGDSREVILILSPESVSRLGVSAKLAPRNPLPMQRPPILGPFCRVSQKHLWCGLREGLRGASGPFERASRCSEHLRGCGLAGRLQGIEL